MIVRFECKRCKQRFIKLADVRYHIYSLCYDKLKNGYDLTKLVDVYVRAE